jgi:hypothetical protein
MRGAGSGPAGAAPSARPSFTLPVRPPFPPMEARLAEPVGRVLLQVSQPAGERSGSIAEIRR